MADPDSRTGRSYASAAIFEWVDRVHARHDEGLARAFTAPEREGLPPIQVGPQEGKLLYLLLSLLGARKVVEIGTLAGYSAIHIARAIGPSGRLWTIESEPKHAEVARTNLAAAGLDDRTEIVVGNALEMLPGLAAKGPFDAVFVDADKENYARYGQWAEANLRRGGLLIGDNAFLFGDLLADSERGAQMRRFHERIAAAFDSVCVPTPDGVVVGVKR
jgi:caffeoyl-CoA O-methyltransferase